MKLPPLGDRVRLTTEQLEAVGQVLDLFQSSLFVHDIASVLTTREAEIVGRLLRQFGRDNEARRLLARNKAVDE